MVFLVAIRNLEYSVGGRVMRTQIHARAWELLLAMLVVDTTFRPLGVVAAPIYYAHRKTELSAQNLT